MSINNNENDFDASDHELLTCDLCFHLARSRCVGLNCCSTIVCRSCAVSFIETHQKCWMCGTSIDKEEVTRAIVIKSDLREWVIDVDRDRPLSLKQRAFLLARRKNVEEWREKRKILQKIQDEEEEENGGFTFCNFNKPVTDLERIALTKKAFRNLDDIDVELNLSFHGYIRFGGDMVHEYSKRMLPLKSGSIKLGKGKIIAHEGYEKCRKIELEELEQDIKVDEDENEMGDHVDGPKLHKRMREQMLISVKKRFEGNYEGTVSDKEQLRFLVKHFTEGILDVQEVKTLVSLNQNNNNDAGVSSEKADEIIATVKHLAEYQEYYGLTQETECKTCNTTHLF